jgi:hypothetical protein
MGEEVEFQVAVPNKAKGLNMKSEMSHTANDNLEEGQGACIWEGEWVTRALHAGNSHHC